MTDAQVVDVLSAPPEVEEQALRQFVAEKSFWIYSRLAEKERLQRSIPTKEYVDGEGFLNLGRSYRLKLVDEQDVPLKLSAGRFRLQRSELPRAREHFIRWYSAIITGLSSNLDGPCVPWHIVPHPLAKPIALMISLSRTSSGVTTASLSISLPLSSRSRCTSNESN